MLDKNKVKLGIAPIAWTNDDMPDLGAENTFEQCISEMALAGFTGCEVGNQEIQRYLKRHLSFVECRFVTLGSQASLSQNLMKKLKRTSSSISLSLRKWVQRLLVFQNRDTQFRVQTFQFSMTNML